MNEDLRSLTVSVLPGQYYALWDEFVAQSPQGTFFHTSRWADILSRHFQRPYQILLIYRNNQPAAGCLVFEHKRWGKSLITPLALFPYSGPIFYRPQNEKPQKTIADYAKLNSILISYLNQTYPLWILETSYLLTDLRAFQWAGCTIEPAYTYLLDLDDRDKMAERFSSSLRKKIRQASEMPFQAITATDPVEFIKLYLASYQRHGMQALIPADTLCKLLPDLLALPQVRMYYLQLQNQIVSGRIIVIDRNMIYDLLTGGADESGLASAYLLSHIFESFSAQNFRVNFLGADHPQIEQFKRSFGGQLVHGFRITRPLRFPLSSIFKIRKAFLLRKRIL
jgi:hypothetical protein